MNSSISGPFSYKGCFGEKLAGELHLLRIVDFTPIFCPGFPVIPEDTLKGLSNDLKYLYKICKAVMAGEFLSVI